MAGIRMMTPPPLPTVRQPVVLPSRSGNPRAGVSCGAPLDADVHNQMPNRQPSGQASQGGNSNGGRPIPVQTKGGPSITHKSGDEVAAYLKMKPKGVIVAKFDSCGFCKKLMNDTLPNLKTTHPVTVVDASEMSKLPKNMQVSGFPTIFLVDGEVKKTHPGYMPAEKLDALITEVLG